MPKLDAREGVSFFQPISKCEPAKQKHSDEEQNVLSLRLARVSDYFMLIQIEKGARAREKLLLPTSVYYFNGAEAFVARAFRWLSGSSRVKKTFSP
jgi:hypothetical protein